MFGYLTILSGFAVLITLLILVLLFRKKDFREMLRYCVLGFLVAFIDFVFEYMGTSTSHWKYHESLYFILDLIPIELVFLFFSAGVILRFISLNMNRIRIPLKANAIFYILIMASFMLWIRESYMESETSMLPLAIVIGLWGISNISDRNKEAALILALLAVLIDMVTEVFIIESGSYSYRSGFTSSIPVIYGLYTLGLLAVMERLYKLDVFLDHSFISKLLKLFGVYREKALKELEKDKDKLDHAIKKGPKGLGDLIERSTVKSPSIKEAEVEKNGRSTVFHGFITNESTGEVIEGVEVKAVSETSGETVAKATSNKQGFYSMNVPSRDQYTITIESGGEEFRENKYAQQGWTYEVWFSI